MLIPNTPGGGYDVTARTASRILEKHGLTGPIEKFNVIGGGGSVALARLVRETGNSALIGMVGMGVVGVAQVAEAPWDCRTPPHLHGWWTNRRLSSFDRAHRCRR